MPPEDEVKRLTPEDVSNKRFTPVRLREGYDMGEVDQFLDQVEAELGLLHAENKDLRDKLAARGGRADDVPAPAAPVSEVAEKPEAEPSVAAAEPRETIKVVTAAEASGAALRLLELATRNADEVVAEAKEEAEKIEQEARSRAHNLEAETAGKREELLGDIERERTRLNGEVDTLRAFEREYRSRLKSYFTEQLRALDEVGEGGELSGTGEENARTRLNSILGGEHSDPGTAAAGQDGEGDTGPEDGDGERDDQESGHESGENPRP